MYICIYIYIHIYICIYILYRHFLMWPRSLWTHVSYRAHQPLYSVWINKFLVIWCRSLFICYGSLLICVTPERTGSLHTSANRSCSDSTSSLESRSAAISYRVSMSVCRSCSDSVSSFESRSAAISYRASMSLCRNRSDSVSSLESRSATTLYRVSM